MSNLPSPLPHFKSKGEQLVSEAVQDGIPTPATVRHHLEVREESLSPFATRSTQTRGRQVPDALCPIRTEFQRDRDRIVHSKAFRRLKHKTQVFIAPLGDHFVTRLTHTLEVSQIGRTIARALNLNEDLTEAISLGHDLGHTPFGHIGEDQLNIMHPEGFRHSQQSLKIVDQLEKDGVGLNLTWEVRQGIVSHSKPRGDFLNADIINELTPEAQICRVSDAVAYLNHDLGDAFRSGALREDDIPTEVVRVLGQRHSERVNTMVTDIIENSWGLTGLNESSADGAAPVITMGPNVREAVNSLREFMFQNVYDPEDASEEGLTARRVVSLLYRHYNNHRDEIPQEYHQRSESEDHSVVDYIASMTDRYALRIAEKLQPGIAQTFYSRQL